VQPPSQPPPELTALLQEEFLRDERVLWQGQPDPSKHFAPSDVFAIPFSLLWGGFALFWEASALGLVRWDGDEGRAPLFFVLWGIPFVLIGLYLMVGRFFYKAWRKRRTLYAVTDRRVLS